MTVPMRISVPILTWLPRLIACGLLLGVHAGLALAAEFNPFFRPAERPPPPILATIQGQIERGCVSGYQGKRPLADRFDLRHGLPQPENPALARTAAAISIADPAYDQARRWLWPLLTDADPNTAYIAHALLLSHAARRIGMEGASGILAADLRRAGELAETIGANPSDHLFWLALVAWREGSREKALKLVRAARNQDPWFYNARLLELEILLAPSRRRRHPISAMGCRQQTEAVLGATVALFDLDTCPRHAVLLLNWLRAGRQDPVRDPFAQLVSTYVAVVLNNTTAFEGALRNIAGPPHAPCRRQILAKARMLTPLLDRQTTVPASSSGSP